jgi:ribosome biogenesis GTPase / thiamine phosphate phosphatase
MQGKIIKGIAGFYYVHIESCGIYECKAKGIFRNKKIKPLVGDNVIIDIIDNDKMTGNIIQILPRKNELIRPASANIDQAMVIFAVKSPEPNYNLLDRFIMMMDYQNVPTVVVFNKIDLAEDNTLEELSDIYEKCGCKVIFISTYDNKGIDIVLKTLEKKTTILAGPSGVGKSSLTNLILPQEVSATGDVSRIGRGRHTTRHSEIFNVSDATYICDTPGFTSLNIMFMSCIHTISYLYSNAYSLFIWKFASLFNILLKGNSLNKFHNYVIYAILNTDIIHIYNIRISKSSS